MKYFFQLGFLGEAQKSLSAKCVAENEDGYSMYYLSCGWTC